jgi:hypothetical protein
MKVSKAMQTYIIHYTRIDPVYGRGWVVVSHKRISATRRIKALTMEAAQDKVLNSILKDRPQSTVEFATMMVVS